MDIIAEWLNFREEYLSMAFRELTQKTDQPCSVCYVATFQENHLQMMAQIEKLFMYSMMDTH